MIDEESAFEELVIRHANKAGITSVAGLTLALNEQAPREEGYPLYWEEEVRLILQQKAGVYPAFFQRLDEALGLTEEEGLAVSAAYFNRVAPVEEAGGAR